MTDLARRIYPYIPAVFADTGLEYPEVRAFAMSYDNLQIVKPKMRFDEVIKQYGWCFPSKDVSNALYYAKRGSGWAINRRQKSINWHYGKRKFPQKTSVVTDRVQWF
jgi:3'-phosphoadenosine 5'-phosphosulfate sulfotransferase (PAPS reductase)/FAD synthetase